MMPREATASMMGAALGCVGFFALGPLDLAGQARRSAPIQPVSEVTQGDLLLGLGAAGSWGGSYPLSGFGGDVLGLGDVTIGYGLGDRALVQLRGVVRQRLTIRERGLPSIPLDPSTIDGTSWDAGDFRLSTVFAPIGSREGFSAGALIEVKLPNTDHEKGIGSNTTDFAFSALGSWGSGRTRATGALGVAILEAPLDDFVQNDLVAYAFDLAYRASGRLRLSIGATGLANLLDNPPLGTESRGGMAATAEWRSGGWLIDVGVHRGYAGASPDWRLEAGAAWLASGGR